jgi:hypothetical protein
MKLNSMKFMSAKKELCGKLILAGVIEITVKN